MNIKDISTQLLFTTAQIWCERKDKTVSSGTAFFFNCPIPSEPDKFIPFLITNNHVISGAFRGVVALSEAEGDSPKLGAAINVEIELTLPAILVDADLDLAAIPIGVALNAMSSKGKVPFFRGVEAQLIPTSEQLADLAAVEDVVFIGYPSGLRDNRNGLPIVRRGITASPVWADFEGKPEFLIDAGVFPGSSGSPVFILNQGAYPTREGLTVGSRLFFLGVLSQSLLRNEIKSSIYLGLGRVVRSREVANFIQSAAQSLHKGWSVQSK